MFIEKFYLWQGKSDVSHIPSGLGHNSCISIFTSSIGISPANFLSLAQALPTSFCIFIDTATNDFESLIRFFFLNNYKKINNRPVILVVDSESLKYTKESLLAIAEAQGFESLETFVVDSNCIWQANANQSAEVQQIFTDNIEKLMNNWLAGNNYNKGFSWPHIYLQVTAIDQAILLNQYLEIAEKQFFNDKKTLYNLLQTLLLLQTQNRFFLGENSYLTTELDNRGKYLNMQKGEAKYILDWYNKEYEVLPLWYKRVGHILKVIQGKRSLKSLFK